ncbi:MAG: hypothetical protein ACYTDY_09515 [Planctomycetota bacterium]|jgi:hypothetical protein
MAKVVLDGVSIEGGNGNPGGINVQAATEIHVTGNVDLYSDAWPIEMYAYGGNITVDGAYNISTNSGNLILDAKGAVRIQNASSLYSGSGETRVLGRSDLPILPAVTIESSTVGSGSGNITIVGKNSVGLRGNAQVHSDSGKVSVHSEKVGLYEDARLGRGIFYYSPIEVRAGEIESPDDGGTAHIHGSTVDLFVGGSGVSLNLNLDLVRAETGDLRVWCAGDAVFRGRLEAHESVSIEGGALLLDLGGATVTTDDRTGEASGPVLIENWAGASGTIDLTNATVASGQSDTMSGDVTVRIRRALAPGDAPTEGWVLPKRVVLKLNEVDPSRSRIIVAGFCDLGLGTVDLTADATLEVGKREISVPGMTPNRRETRFMHRADGTKFIIKPSRRGSSLAKFKLVLRADLSGDVDPESVLTLHLVGAGVDGTGAISLTKGKYALRRVRGALVEPTLHLAKAKAKLAGAGKDKLSLLLGLATDGTTPTEAADLAISFGEGLSVTIPADQLTPKGDRFEFRGDIGGITRVVLDYRKEILKIKGAGLDLGAFEEGGNSVDVSVGLGADERAVRVRMARKGSSLRY